MSHTHYCTVLRVTPSGLDDSTCIPSHLLFCNSNDNEIVSLVPATALQGSVAINCVFPCMLELLSTTVSITSAPDERKTVAFALVVALLRNEMEANI